MATKPTRAPTAHIVPFGLRLQPELKGRIEKAASENGRSLNSEIALRIEQSFESAGLALPDELRSRLEEHAKEYGRTLDEEIINRLQHSFDWDEYFIPVRLQRELTAYRKINGLDSKEAVERLVSAGLHKDAPCVLVLTIDADMDLDKFVASLEEAKARLPKGTAVLMEQYPMEIPHHGKKPGRKLDI